MLASTKMRLYSNLRHLHRLSSGIRTLSTSELPRRPKESHYKSLCKLTLIGRTGSEPQLREFDEKKAISLSVATNSANGETQWHKVLVSEQVPGFDFLQELPTGSQVYVEGNMRINSFVRDDGSEKTYVNVSVYPGMGMIRVLRFPSMGPRLEKDIDNLPF